MSASILAVAAPELELDREFRNFAAVGRGGAPVLENNDDEKLDRRRNLPVQFTFDHFKWLASMIIAIIGIYVISERRAATTDLSAAYLDRKVNEINERMDKRFEGLSSDLNSMRTSVQSLALTDSSRQSEMKAMAEQIREIKNAQTVQQTAYNFNFTTRLAAAEAKLGIKPTKE